MSARGTDSRGRVRVLIAAGGTGGHVYPALAVAEWLRTEGVGVIWLGTAAGLEAKVVPSAGIELRCLTISGLRGAGIRRWLLAPLVLLRALWQSLRGVWECRARLVLGMGGYVSGPSGVAAWLLRRPLVIHEQNAIPGFTNRLLAPLATRVLEAFPGTFPARRRAVHTGNPVRPAIAHLPDPGRRFCHPGPLRVLVLGGSQGARVLNEVVPVAVAALPDPDMVQVRHQAGERNLEAARAGYQSAGLAIVPESFIEDMAGAYAWADLVVCRAGAMTISELAAAGTPSILVPFPFAVDDHQTRNAEFLSRTGAAVLVPEERFDGPTLGRMLEELHGARQRLASMAQSARTLAGGDATERVARICLETAHA